MFFVDTHMHSAVSFDSTAPRWQMAKAAAEQGFSLICFTDHYDVIDEHSQFCPSFNWPAARAEHQAALDRDHGLVTLCYGLELGNAFGSYSAAEQALAEPGLDFVIGSVHNASEKLGYVDYYQVSHFTPELCRIYLEDYFASMLELTEWGKFDSLGHLPYPLRYMRDRDGCAVSLQPYQEQITAILERIIASDIALEVNTKQFQNARADYAALLDRYRELGGHLITCGADAHRPAEVGAGIAEAYELIQSKGFRYLTVYRSRKPEFINF